MFLAHFSGWAYSDLMGMGLAELTGWYNQAVDIHNHLHKPPPAKK